jgi:hypothetical protein
MSPSACAERVGTGHRLAAPRMRHPFEPPMDQCVWETLACALF